MPSDADTAPDAELRQALRAWVLQRASGLDPTTLTDQTPLFKARYLRSVHLPELLLLLERLRGVPIDVEDLRSGDFRDIDTLVRCFGTGATAPPARETDHPGRSA